MALRVFLLVGQSNMEGKGSIVHLSQLLNESTTRNLYQHLRQPNGNWKERDDVYIKFNDDRGEGKLTVAYGVPSDRFGVELEFGNVVGDAFSENILLIKCAWCGKDLAIDFRPPSSGIGNYTYCVNGDCKPYRPLHYGVWYRKTMSIVQGTLKQYKGYTLSGIVWFQGWNDIIDDKKTQEYGYNLANLIRDTREDLESPNLPFVVGELGQQGVDPDPRYREKHLRFRKIQKDVTELSQFKGNTLFVKTSPYVIKDGESFDGDYHYYGRADTFFHIGHAFGKGVLQLIAQIDTSVAIA
jgi:alpha-galactosidase